MASLTARNLVVVVGPQSRKIESEVSQRHIQAAVTYSRELRRRLFRGGLHVTCNARNPGGESLSPKRPRRHLELWWVRQCGTQYVKQWGAVRDRVLAIAHVMHRSRAKLPRRQL